MTKTTDKTTDKTEKITKPESKKIQNIVAEEKSERFVLPEGKIQKELPASLIPGQKEFNRKRLQDIENLKNQNKKTRARDKTPRPEIVKKSIKLVKKIFKKK
jgi:hypothetical protein